MTKIHGYGDEAGKLDADILTSAAYITSAWHGKTIGLFLNTLIIQLKFL